MAYKRLFYLGLTLLPALFGLRAQAERGDPTYGFMVGILVALPLLLLPKIFTEVVGRRRFKALYTRLQAADLSAEEEAMLVGDLAAMMARRSGIIACFARHGITDVKPALSALHRSLVAGGAKIVIKESRVDIAAMCDPAVLAKVLAAEDTPEARAQAAIGVVRWQYDNVRLRGRKISAG